MLEGNNAKNANLSISVNNGKSTTSPTTNKDLNYKTINNNTIISSAWHSWLDGDAIFEINLQGWIDREVTKIAKAFVSI